MVNSNVGNCQRSQRNGQLGWTLQGVDLTARTSNLGSAGMASVTTKSSNFVPVTASTFLPGL